MAKVGIKVGAVYDKKSGRQIETLSEALTKESECGCGIDCCKGELVLRDKATGEPVRIEVLNGVLQIVNEE